MNVHSTVFLPLAEGESYLVVASVLPPQVRGLGALPQRRAVATTLQHAAHVCCRLAREVWSITEEMGHSVSGIRCSHCPTPERPACGRLAVAAPGVA